MVYSNYQILNNNYGYTPAFRGAYNNAPAANSASFGGTLTDKETKALTDCYVSSPSESIGSAAIGGASFALINNPRFIAHPINSIKGIKPVDELFKPVMTKGSALNELWTNPETNAAMRDAYCEMSRAFARGEKKLGLFRKRYSEETVKNMKKLMKKALEEAEAEVANPEKAREIITRATKTLESGYVSDGPLGFIGRLLGNKAKTTAEGIADTATIEKNVAESLAHSGTSFQQALKNHASAKSVLGWAAFEFVFSLGNIKRAFDKDRENKENGIKTNYGIKQVCQTAVKGAGSGIGWGVGEAVGNWLFTKYGTKLGTKFHPAAGTITGGIIGFAVASVGMMLTGRLTKKLVGEDIGAKLEAQELTKTPEGQAQLLQNVYEKAKKGEASPEAVAALQKIVNQSQMGIHA